MHMVFRMNAKGDLHGGIPRSVSHGGTPRSVSHEWNSSDFLHEGWQALSGFLIGGIHMFDELSTWLDHVLDQAIPNEVVAFCFNLYEDGHNRWSMEVVGTDYFDADDGDWGCDEVTDFGTRENCYTWEAAKEWDEILNEIISHLKSYLESGTYAALLKEKSGIGVGFVDGDIEIIYQQ